MELALYLVAGALAALVLAGDLVEWNRKPLMERDRERAPGRFHRLSGGRTHAVRTGPEEGPLVVAVHGLSTPAEVWAPLAEALAARGLGLLRHDLYGRGFSDAPRRRHDAAFHARQLADLLEAEGVTGPVPLLGYSMGGAIVTAFAETYPERAAGLALVAPAGFRHGLGGLYAIAARVPVLGDALWSLAAGPMLRRGAAREARAPGCALPDLPDIIARETRRRGYLPALLSSLRHTVEPPRDTAHRRLAGRGLPVLALWGGRDAVIPPEGQRRLARANPDARQIVLDDAGHGLPYTHVEALADALADWLRTLPQGPERRGDGGGA